MSTAALVPETRDLSGDDAWQVLRRTGRARLLKDSAHRMRVGDGSSHARSFAFMVSLVAVQGVIALEGLASALGRGRVTDAIVATIRRAVPGPAGQVLTTAVAQAHNSAAAHHYTALLVGTLGCLVTGTTALAQLERGLNRTYGIEEDRPGIRKYGLAFLLTISAGTLSLLAFASLTFGAELFAKTGNKTFKAVWDVVRWPLGLALITVAFTLLLRWCPRRRQPRLSWLAFGSAVSVFLWALVTVGLGLFYRNSKSFGQTYGPLAGIVALQIWCLLSSMALFYGGAVTAQLEAVRAGRPEPQDAAKAAASEPDARNRRVSALVS